LPVPAAREARQVSNRVVRRRAAAQSRTGVADQHEKMLHRIRACCRCLSGFDATFLQREDANCKLQRAVVGFDDLLILIVAAHAVDLSSAR
jgi:hypothetical protein